MLLALLERVGDVHPCGNSKRKTVSNRGGSNPLVVLGQGLRELFVSLLTGAIKLDVRHNNWVTKRLHLGAPSRVVHVQRGLLPPEPVCAGLLLRCLLVAVLRWAKLRRADQSRPSVSVSYGAVVAFATHRASLAGGLVLSQLERRLGYRTSFTEIGEGAGDPCSGPCWTCRCRSPSRTRCASRRGLRRRSRRG
jgi:hypothetical protein